mmetsp:Transcript_34147/g.56550  ORF Transcript_34147/g.56550 Transcript_34147/m.56550 type:complete len:87 (-) Transcript_34147:266-526(-)
MLYLLHVLHLPLLQGQRLHGLHLCGGLVQDVVEWLRLQLLMMCLGLLCQEIRKWLLMNEMQLLRHLWLRLRQHQMGLQLHVLGLLV